MKFQIEQDEYESSQETKQGEAYVELVDAKKKLEFYEDMYQIDLRMIKRRNDMLLWSIWVQLGTIVLAVILILIFSINFLFGFTAIGVLLLCIAFLIYSTIRCAASWAIHNARIKGKPVYTLEQEQRDKEQEIRRVREDIHKLDIMLKQRQAWSPDESPEVTAERNDEDFEKKGKELLDEIALELICKERRADYLYGEFIR